MNVVETLAAQFKESSQLIQNLLQEKYRVESPKLVFKLFWNLKN